MKIRLTLTFLILLTLTSSSHKRGNDKERAIDKKWILENTIEIKVESSSEILKMDFSKVGDLVGDASVVLLGEQNHGDGAAFIVKTSLIKFLHEEKGFNVVAFESGFFEINSIWQYENDIDRKVDNIRKNLYGIWGQSKQTQPLFKYLKEENRKGRGLVISGFDSRHSSHYSKEHYINRLDSVVKITNLSVLKEPQYLTFKTIASDLISKEYSHEPKKNDKDLFFETLDKISIQLEKAGHSDSQFWLQELKNLKGNAKSVWNDKSNRRESVNQRDQQMADNLLWLIQQKFKDEKIIVWAANYHIAKNDNQVVKQKYYDHEEHEPMGEILAPLLGDKMVNIGFTSSSGQYTDVTYKNTKRDIKVSPNSLEGLLDNTQYHYGFINFKENQLDNIEPFTMSPFAHFELQGKWNHVFDGVFYIRQMTPSEF